MKSTLRKKLTLLMTVFCILSISTVRAESQNINKTFTVKSGGTLTLESDQGLIEVQTWNQNKVEVTVKKKARNQKKMDSFIVSIKQQGNDVLVVGEDEGNGRVSIEYLIKVPQQYNLDLDTGGGSIHVSDISGKVKVNTSGGSIEIGNVSDGNVNADTSGGSIKVGNVSGGNVAADTSGGSIRVGDVTGNLQVDTSGGSIKLGKIQGTSEIETSGGSITLEQGGDDVSAETSGGSINIGPVNGKVSVDTAGGSIQIGLAEGDVTADTSGGSINVEGSKGSVTIDSSGGSLFVGSSGGPVKADTSGGNIKILQARGFIEADTAGGKIEAEMILADKDADTHVTLETAGGDITVYLPKNLAATISASLKITRSARRDYRIYSDFPLTIKGEDSDRVTAKGKINGGGDKVRLETTNGDIHIKMLEN